MESISTELLQKYDSIINEINREYEKSKALEYQLHQENNSIAMYNLIKTDKLTTLSHVDVKVFNNAVDLLNLYEEDSDKSILYSEGYKYYLIEVYVSKHLMEKLYRPDWLVVISLSNTRICINKSRKLPKKSFIVTEVIPVPEDIINCTVEAYLVNTNNQWMCTTLDYVQVDISYHFHKHERRSENKLAGDILQLNNLYNKSMEINFVQDFNPLYYEFFVPIEKQKFIEVLIQNAYQNLDIELFSELQNENAKDFNIQLITDIYKIEVTFNRKDRIKLKGNHKDFKSLKEYFLKQYQCHNQVPKLTVGLNVVKNSFLKNLSDALNLYSMMRKISFSLSV